MLSSFKTLWNCICLLAILQIYVVHRSVISPFVHCVWISLYIYRVVTSLDMKITLTSQLLKSLVTQLDCLFNRLFRQTSKPAFQALCEGIQRWSMVPLTKSQKRSPRSWPFVRKVHQWPMVSPHKRLVMQKTFPCHDVITIYSIDPPIQTCIHLKHTPLSKRPARALQCFTGRKQYLQ